MPTSFFPKFLWIWRNSKSLLIGCGLRIESSALHLEVLLQRLDYKKVIVVSNVAVNHHDQPNYTLHTSLVQSPCDACGWWWVRSSKSQPIIGLGLGLERRSKWLLSALLALGYNVEVDASSPFSSDLDLWTLKWCHMSMNNHAKWVEGIDGARDGVNSIYYAFFHGSNRTNSKK
jgi:hypothetical protein